MPVQRMGFEGQIFQGAVGSEATNLMQNSRDINYAFDHDKGDTTVRGDSVTRPIETARVTVRKVTIDWQMTNQEGDTNLSALLAAAYAGDPIALRLKDKVNGKGYNGDVIVTVKQGKPYRGEQTYDFSATPTREYREPVLYA